jgi:hypothetical protein
MRDEHDQIINLMIEQNHIPANGMFEVDLNMLDKFYDTYKEIYPSKNKKIKKSNIAYAKRLAGLNLMKLSILRGESEALDKS